ncbi:hypothetical protein CC78DRAFT_535833 [Lojkania enalia]|uniref:N-acetyltransferase domain-containing protein n=1 Tax=Lojkania enalia TaxID=147567 RepID=A0A9P4K4M6_9PLEO|nr:hypothetical protein CC78DRAFT_535833 [Didymosphaeria enalia]
MSATLNQTTETSTAPVGLQSRLYYAKDIRADPALATSLWELVNNGYRNPKSYDPKAWDPLPIRFATIQELYEMLGDDGVFAAIHDGDKLIACASATPWHGDISWQSSMRRGKENDLVIKTPAYFDPNEKGWELKAVVVLEGYLKQGLATKCLTTLQNYLLEREMANGGDGDAKLRLWVHTVEFVNGPYWRRRGWKNIRVHRMPKTFWGCTTEFDLVVMAKDVDIPVQKKSEDVLHLKASDATVAVVEC